VSMGQRVTGPEGLGSGNEGLPFEGATDQVDDMEREVGEVS
jgi:hypothetical protein